MKRSGFSMIELVFVIVILGVLAAVAVPRFVATRTDAQVATARSDLASAQKAIVAKVFADNIDPTQSTAPDPNIAVAKQNGAFTKKWGDWIMEVAGLDAGRWQVGGKEIKQNQASYVSVKQSDGIQPIGNVKGGQKGGCSMVLGIATEGGYMVFAPNNIGGDNIDTNNPNSFCGVLRKSYESSGSVGNKVVPLASTGTVEF